MTFPIYATIAAVLTVFFLLSYLKQKRPFQLAFAIWVPSTLLQYISNNRMFYNILSVVEILMFLGVLFLLYQDQKKQKEIQKQNEEGKTE